MQRHGKILVVSFQSLTEKSAAGIGMLGYYVAKALDKKKLLDSFIVSSKGNFETDFNSKPVHFSSRYYLYIINKLPIKSHFSRYLQEASYDRFCARHIHKNIGAILTTTPYLQVTFEKAKRFNIPVYFIPGNPEDNYIYDLVSEESEKFGIEQIDGYTYKKRLDYYNKSIKYIDKIITFSSVMHESYVKKGWSEKLISIQGYLKPEMKAIQNTAAETDVFKVAFFSYNVLLKGLQYVLEAWKLLQHLENIELHIGGPLDPMLHKIIEERYADLKKVHYHGIIRDIPSFFKDKSLYVLSSIIDGAPVSILEAMNSGVPVICSENCGTKDIIEEGKNGWIIPIRNVEAICEKVLEAYNNPAKTKLMGKAAKEKIESYSMDEFVQNVLNIITKHQNR